MEEEQEIRSLQKVEMKAVVEPIHLPILEEQEEVSEVVETSHRAARSTRSNRTSNGTRRRYRGNRISVTARGRSSYRRTKNRARRSIRSSRTSNRIEEDTEAVESVTEPEDVPAIVELKQSRRSTRSNRTSNRDQKKIQRQ